MTGWWLVLSLIYLDGSTPEPLVYHHETNEACMRQLAEVHNLYGAYAENRAAKKKPVEFKVEVYCTDTETDVDRAR